MLTKLLKLRSRVVICILRSLVGGKRKTSFADRNSANVEVTMAGSDQSLGIHLKGGVLLPGRWGHVAFAIDVVGAAKLIVDGVQVASGVFRGALYITCTLLKTFFVVLSFLFLEGIVGLRGFPWIPPSVHGFLSARIRHPYLTLPDLCFVSFLVRFTCHLHRCLSQSVNIPDIVNRFGIESVPIRSDPIRSNPIAQHLEWFWMDATYWWESLSRQTPISTVTCTTSASGPERSLLLTWRLVVR